MRRGGVRGGEKEKGRDSCKDGRTNRERKRALK